MSGPLSGMRVVNTRAAHQAVEFDRLLMSAGATPIPYPCIAIARPLDDAPLATETARLLRGGFDWLAFTSVNAVTAMTRAIAAHGWRAGDPIPVKIAAVGDATASAIRQELDQTVTEIPPVATAAALVHHAVIRPSESVLIPASEIARDDLAAGLSARGVRVVTVVAYRTVIGEGGADVPVMLARGQLDAVTFTSPSCVTGFVTRHRRESGRKPLLDRVAVACIGGTTLATAQEHGFGHALAPASPSLPGLLSVLTSTLVASRQGEPAWPSN